MISAVGLYVLMYDEERAAMDYRERVWGYTGATGMVQALGCGYFLWDFWISLVNVKVFGAGLLGHAASALWVYGMGFVSNVYYRSSIKLTVMIATIHRALLMRLHPL